MPGSIARKNKKLAYGVLYAILSLSLILAPIATANAAGTYDQTAGTYTEDFADNTGLSARTRTATDGALKLTNASDVIAAPYVASGTAVTDVLIPDLVAAWGTLTISKTEPAGTAVTVQVLDEARGVYTDDLLSGNEAGFSGSSIDLSSLPIDRAVTIGSAKIGRIALKFTLTTTDTSVTPSVDGFSLAWTKTQGDLSNSALSTAGWPTPNGGLFNKAHMSGSAEYIIHRWVRDQGVDYGGSTLRGDGETIYNKTQGGIASWPTTTDSTLSAIDRRDGSTIWTKDVSGYAFTPSGATLAAGGTIYANDIFNDVLIAFDGSDGSVKWSKQFNAGHGNSSVNIDSNGMLYLTRNDSGDDAFTILAVNPDGTTEWGTTENPAGTVSAGQVSISDGKVYVSTSGLSGGVYNNTGLLYAFDQTDGSLLWTYPTGDIGGNPPIIDTDGTIYTANSSNVSGNKSVYAINPDGTLKWAYTLSSSTNYWGRLTLRSDGVLVAARINSAYPATGGALDAISTTDGSLLWSETLVSTDDSFGSEIISDSENGVIVRTIVYTDITGLRYYDANHVNKWNWENDGAGSDVHLNFLSGDEDGNVYVSMFTGGDNGRSESELFAFSPWNLNISSLGSNIHPDDTVTISVTTNMPRLDPLTGGANKMQAVMADGTKATLDYVSADSDGVTLWRGTYTVPSNAFGAYNFDVEASNVLMSTDTATHFDTPANSGNTGRVVSASYTVEPYENTSSGSRPKHKPKNDPVPPKPGNDKKEADDAGCQPGYKFSPTSGRPCGTDTPVPAAPSSCSITATLKFGSSGEQVRCLQARLGLLADGLFGPMTREAVKAFQAEKGLIPDGIFGPMSLAAWNSAYSQ